MPRTHPDKSLLNLIPFWALFLVLWTGTAFAASGSPGNYEVRKGDNLGLIAYRFGVTVDELRSSNNLTSDVLQIGQKLRLEKPFHRPADIKWEPPCRRHGKVLRHFGPYKKKGIIMPSTGTDVTCALGTAVSSPAHGIVRHIGHMDGFGTLIIIEHGEGYATVFSPLDPAAVAVELGTAVLRGDHLGRTGPPPERDTPPFLHVELRKNDKAVKPDRLFQ
ncbi:MAG: LysM peptidoglycan-binding domain-containing M23 family metallopeptidase [Candidatus Krumholzibacteria bacterium]|nr:LysM peptidoglycan-binding domain-containing M23 family metallopeptidase [Candidatus Krumholzibacteria bacterium]